MSDQSATTRVAIYRVHSGAVTAVGEGSLIDPQVVVLHADAADAFADELGAAAAGLGRAARPRVEVSSEGAVLVTDGILGTSDPQFGPAIAVIALDMPSAAPLEEVAGLVSRDLFTKSDPAGSGWPQTREADEEVEAIAAAIRLLVGAGPTPFAGPTAGAPAAALAHRTVSPLCRLFPWLPFC